MLRDSHEEAGVFQSEGGSGKTTLAVHTAVAAQERGERVVLVDIDPQESTSSWGNARHNETPEIVAVGAASLHDVIKAARRDAMTLCIIDTPPHAAPDAARAAEVADLVVIPCRPTAFDAAAAPAAVEIVKAPASLPCLSFLPVRSAHPRSPRRANC
jgi:chromosome partitioning protein